ncbi:MAG: LysM peptidoglycan-binding domain-containing protein [Deltaproteobacteria bacterium]|nr:LysM peptidoglycan-binding domain-containing protein [Deltaproteobacteria bacterium]MBW2154690.1 LysM peptidoglycan-binding domain-containing protein [Deltaproteobacteria bacterium]
MKWKNTYHTNSMDDDPREDLLDETDYPLWEKRKKSSLKESLLKKIEIPFLLVSLGIGVLIVLFVVSIFGKETRIEPSQFKVLEKRLGLLEDRVFKLEGSGYGLNKIEEQGDQLKRIQDRMEKLEASIALRMDQLSTELYNLQKKTSNFRLQTPAVSRPVITEKSARKKYHQVRSGETLYSIGRKYGITVKELLRLNNMSSGDIIYPGQKLVVGSAR